MKTRPTSNDVLLNECTKLAPDFRISEEPGPGGRAVVARCTKNGKPVELALLIDPRVDTKRMVLEGSLSGLRRR